MKTIIVATNFSSAADNAMRYAANALMGKEYQIILFNHFVPSIHALNARIKSEEIDRMQLVRNQKITLMAANIEEVYGVKTLSYLATGLLHEELAHCIETYGASMVVMGMARKSLEQDLLGNTTTMLINRIKCPILSIPADMRYREIRKILFACDVVRGIHKKILENVRSFAKDFGAAVEVFYVKRMSNESTISTNTKQELSENLYDITYSYKDVYSEEIVKSIELEIEISRADLLIMIPYKYGFWNSIFHTSKTRVMASASQIPLLSIRL